MSEAAGECAPLQTMTAVNGRPADFEGDLIRPRTTESRRRARMHVGRFLETHRRAEGEGLSPPLRERRDTQGTGAGL